MRKHLLESFDKIYILDLHGNAKKKEICLDGSQDQNVFDIMQGVSINLFLKTGSKKKDVLGQVFHIDLRGKRDVKYDYLNTNSIKNINWNKLKCDSPYYFFVPSNNDLILKYEEGFKVNELFTNYNSGVQTKNDSLTVKFDKTDIDDVINNFKNKTKDELENTLKIKDSAGWNIQKAIDDIRNNIGVCVKIQFRLFDIRYTYYTGQSSGFLGRTRDSVMQHMLRDNYSLIFKRTGRVYGGSYDFFFLSKFMISEGLFIIDPLGREYQAPLYLYQKNTDQLDLYDNVERIPNLNIEIINRISESLKLVFKNEKEQNKSTFSPIDILDYIYAILNSLTYRVTYKDFLKIDFPRIPYPNDLNIFWKLIEFGGELRQLHLLESKVLDSYITRYPVDGNNQIIKLNFFDNKVWINDTQYFDDMPKDAWEFYIGGYQPAQKWLKDRKGRTLSYDDIQHYQKIIVALTETDRLMKEIDNVIEI